MQIILQEDVEKLGTRGQVVEVKAGYARNFLLPRKLALEASAGNMKRLEKMRATFAKKEATEKGDAQKLAELLAGVSLELTRKAGDNDQLFGSVTTQDIEKAFRAEGFEIDKKDILLNEPIKALGVYTVPIRIFEEVIASTKVWVVRE